MLGFAGRRRSARPALQEKQDKQVKKGHEAMANAIKLARKEATTLLFFGLLVALTFCV
ncbi:MAG: hypothetical protein L6Q99_16785 [Planctomycetes bacterium]|nr:hypothetical protein [Planctomycetota bacterium]